jgi:hypothetical protein
MKIRQRAILANKISEDKVSLENERRNPMV